MRLQQFLPCLILEDNLSSRGASTHWAHQTQVTFSDQLCRNHLINYSDSFLWPRDCLGLPLLSREREVFGYFLFLCSLFPFRLTLIQGREVASFKPTLTYWPTKLVVIVVGWTAPSSSFRHIPHAYIYTHTYMYIWTYAYIVISI